MNPRRETGLIGGPEKRDIVIFDYDADWPKQYQAHWERITACLGGKVLALEHVGSTAVPGLSAKPIIDIDLIVADSGDEQAYLPALVEAGYELRVREPDWQEHRMFRTPGRDVHLHVFSPGADEHERHLAFRDWLRGDQQARQAYAQLKCELSSQPWEDMNDYAKAKTEFIEAALRRAGMRSDKSPPSP